MSDENKSYRVTDRRHSTLETERPEEDSTPAETPDAEPAHAPRPESPTADAPADFTTFVLSLGTQAGMLLGGAPEEPPDLKGAKWLISILEMLRDKTEGRRTEQETEVLERILYELRMGYVERARVSQA